LYEFYKKKALIWSFIVIFKLFTTERKPDAAYRLHPWATLHIHKSIFYTTSNLLKLLVAVLFVLARTNMSHESCKENSSYDIRPHMRAFILTIYALRGWRLHTSSIISILLNEKRNLYFTQVITNTFNHTLFYGEIFAIS
jgi:hypothetical protein